MRDGGWLKSMILLAHAAHDLVQTPDAHQLHAAGESAGLLLCIMGSTWASTSGFELLWVPHTRIQKSLLTSHALHTSAGRQQYWQY